MFKTAAILMAAAAALAAAPRTAQAQVRTFTCESYNNRQVACGVDTRGGVRLVEQLSSNSCVQGRTWGATRNAVWVSGGCRARFQVGTSTRYNNGYGSGRHDNRHKKNGDKKKKKRKGEYPGGEGGRPRAQGGPAPFPLPPHTASAAPGERSRPKPPR